MAQSGTARRGEGSGRLYLGSQNRDEARNFPTKPTKQNSRILTTNTKKPSVSMVLVYSPIAARWF